MGIRTCYYRDKQEQKGQRINPLEHVRLQQTLIVLNGKDSSQVAWFNKSPLSEKVSVMVLLTDGSWKEVSEKTGNRPIDFLMKDIKERFDLKAVPSIVTQIGKRIQVKEIYVP